MSIYIYPAILKHGEDGYYVNFPDIENCFTDGDTRNEAIAMAEDVLPLMLCDYEDRNVIIPKPSASEDIGLLPNEEIVLIKADTTQYRSKLLRNSSNAGVVIIKKGTAARVAAKRATKPAAVKASAKRSAKAGVVNKLPAARGKALKSKELKPHK